MDIEVRSYGHARTAIGAKELTWTTDAPATVDTVLAELGEEFGFDDADLVVMKDGRNIKQLDGRETPLEDGSQLTVTMDTINE